MNFIKVFKVSKIDEKKIIFLYFPIAIIITLVLPLIYLSFFSQPNAEDFSLSFTSKETNPFYSVLTLYRNGEGRLFTNLLYAVNPLVFNLLWGYKLIPVFLFVLFFIILSHFIKILSGTESKKTLLFFVSIVFVVYITRLPSIAHAFYWMASSLNYTVSGLMLVFFITRLVNQQFINECTLESILFENQLCPTPKACLTGRQGRLIFSDFPLGDALSVSKWIKGKKSLKKENGTFSSGLIKDKSKADLLNIIINVLLIYIIICSNEIYFLFMLILFAILTVYFFYLKAPSKYLMLTLLISVVSAAVILFLPRIILKDVSTSMHSDMNKIDVISAFKNCFVSTFQNIISWTIFNPTLLVASVLMIAIKKHLVLTGTFFNKLTIRNAFAIGFFVVLFMITSLLPYYLFRENSHIPQRIFNVQYLFFVLFWFICIMTIITRAKNLFRLPRGLTIAIIPAFVFTLFASQNIITLYSDIFSGRARGYNKEMNERFSIINKIKNQNTLLKVALIKPLRNNPTTIYFPPDILPERSYALWNNAYERYFDIDEVRFEKDTLKLLTTQPLIYK